MVGVFQIIVPDLLQQLSSNVSYHPGARGATGLAVFWVSGSLSVCDRDLASSVILPEGDILKVWGHTSTKCADYKEPSFFFSYYSR